MAKKTTTNKPPVPGLRSRLWFDNPGNPGMTALYLERYLNNGLTKEELTSGKPIIGIAQSGSDLVPCNRHHLQLAERVRDGIYAAGGIPLEFPTHPLQETGKRPTAALDRNRLRPPPFDGDRIDLVAKPQKPLNHRSIFGDLDIAGHDKRQRILHTPEGRGDLHQPAKLNLLGEISRRRH